MPQYQISKPPFHAPLTEENGMMHHSWKTYFTSLHQIMNNNFNTQGTQIAPVNPEDVGNSDNGVMYYSSSGNQFEGFINGATHVFTTTPK
jgi:hypothetical protein